jgi:nitroreductase
MTIPNPILEQLQKRRSLRTFSEQPVSILERDAILQAAMRAPTAGNMMLYTILEVNDQALKDRLAITCDNQPMIAKAPYVLLFLADYQRWYDYYRFCGVPELCLGRGEEMRRLQEGDLLLAICDALIAAQSAVVAADSMGIGSCYIGDILEHYEEHREMFDLPPYVMPVTLIIFGHSPAESSRRKLTPRFERSFIVHQNVYHHSDSDELQVMFSERNRQLLASPNRAAEIQNIGQLNYVQKFNAPFSIEMSRSVRAMLKTWTEE